MEYNPFEARLRETDGASRALEQRRAELEEQIAWATTFDLKATTSARERLRSAIDECAADLALREQRINELEVEIAQADAKTAGLERDVHVDWQIVRRWFTGDHALAKKRLENHREGLRRLRKRATASREDVAVCNEKLIDLANELAKNERAAEQFRGFVAADAESEMGEINDELLALRDQRDHLAKRSRDVELAVEEPLAELCRYQAEVDTHESKLRRLESELSDLRSQEDGVEQIRKKLSEAANGYERAKLHEKCGRRFGHEKPGEALREIRDNMRQLTKEISQHESLVRRLRRDMAKAEEHILNLASAAAREIDALVVDGNNCCYSEDEVFVGLAALVPMTNSLAGRYPVTVVFDASIRPLLGITDEEIRAQLHSATVYFAGVGTDADEIVLDAAEKPNSWVISNDRFADFRYKPAVKQRRVIRRVIFPDRVLVRDLRVDEPLLESSDASSGKQG